MVHMRSRQVVAIILAILAVYISACPTPKKSALLSQRRAMLATDTPSTTVPAPTSVYGTPAPGSVPGAPSYDFPGLDVYEAFSHFSSCGFTKKYAALTFDDGPIPQSPYTRASTLEVLDTLDTLGVKATFFLLAKQIQLYPDLAQEIVKRGHTAATHSYTHRSLEDIIMTDAVAEFTESQNVFRKVLGVTPKFMRPPYGELTNNLAAVLQNIAGIVPAMWSMDTKDWDIQGPEDKLPGLQLSYLKQLWATNAVFRQGIPPPSMIVLGHDAHSTKAVLTTYIKYFQQLGYAFVDMDTCYNQWLADGALEAPCMIECETFVNGTCTSLPKTCVQASSGENMACIPDVSKCAANPCGSPGCGLSCATSITCFKGAPLCKASCVGKTCGSDGCGGTCGSCGMGTCSGGKCTPVAIPDLATGDLCRPPGDRNVTVLGTGPYAGIANDLVLTATITAGWDIGFTMVIKVTNVGTRSISNLELKVYNSPYTLLTTIYGYTNLTSLMVSGAATVVANPLTNIPLVAGQTESFMLIFAVDTGITSINPIRQACAPSMYEVVNGYYFVEVPVTTTQAAPTTTIDTASAENVVDGGSQKSTDVVSPGKRNTELLMYVFITIVSLMFGYIVF